MRASVVFVGILGISGLAAARPEPNAFLNKVAPDIKSLVRQIQSDPEVSARYIAHYGLGKPEIIAYLSTLKPSRITKPGPYVVYNVHEDGIVRSRVFNLKAGSLIYIDSVGRPVLKKLCGNPMTKGPAQLSAVNLVQESPVAPPVAMKPIEEVVPQAETPSELMVAEELATPPVEVAPPTVTPPTVTPPVVVPEVKPSFEVGNLGGLSILPLLSGGLIGLIGNGGGHTVVPEPATVGMSLVLLGLYGATRKRSRR